MASARFLTFFVSVTVVYPALLLLMIWHTWGRDVIVFPLVVIPVLSRWIWNSVLRNPTIRLWCDVSPADEDAGAGAQNALKAEYNASAKSYDDVWEDYIQGTLDVCMRHLTPLLADLPHDSQALDIGCGTGVLMEGMCKVLSNSTYSPASEQRMPCITGVDLSDMMLAQAKEKLKKSVPMSCVSFVNGSSDDLPFKSDSVALVASLSSLHFWDVPQSFAAIHRVMKPGARLLITDWCDDYWSCQCCSVYLRLRGYPHWAVLTSNNARTMLDEAGFENITVTHDKFTWMWGLMTVQATKSAKKTQ